jgi:hypothetical protein
MYVYQWTSVAKAGRAREMAQVQLEMLDLIDHPHGVRIYYGEPLGLSNTMIIELEYESLAEFERLRTEWSSKPGWAALGEKLHPLRGKPDTPQEIRSVLTPEELRANLAKAEAE